jgi:hypothetical protein
MNAIRTFVCVIGLFIALSACSKKGSEGMDQDGRCTDATIEANNIIVEALEVKEGVTALTSNLEKLKAAESQCARFANLMGTDSCQALNEKDGTSMTISVEKNRLLCESIRKKLHGDSDPGAPTTPGGDAITKVDTRPLRQFTSGMVLQVKNLAMNQTPHFLLQEGKILHSAGSLIPTKNYCDVKVSKRLPIQRDIPVALTFSESGEVTVSNLVFGLSLECFKRTSPAPWVVEDLKKTFGASLNVFVGSER